MLKVKTILVSQPTPVSLEKSPYREICTKYNINVEYRPFIRIEGVSLKEYRAQRTDILEHSAIIFTSRTTVDHFFRICEESRITVPETMKYLCNTEAIALYLQKYIVYRKRRIFFANGTMPNLLELIVKHKKEELLLILSEPYKPELAMTMEKLKLSFSRAVLSRTVSADLSDIKISDYDMLVFFSPSEIVSLTSQFGTEKLPMIATFGEGTTFAVVDAGLKVNVTAPSPEAPSMAKAVELFISKVCAGEQIAPLDICFSKQSEEFLRTQEAKTDQKRRPRSTSAVNGSANGASKARRVVVKKAAPRKKVPKKDLINA